MIVEKKSRKDERGDGGETKKKEKQNGNVTEIISTLSTVLQGFIAICDIPYMFSREIKQEQNTEEQP